jgi:hypothetical protein
MTRHALLAATLALTMALPARGQWNTTLAFGNAAPERQAAHFQISPEIVVFKDKAQPALTFRLAKSLLLTDETGATDFHQSETLSDRVWVKKVFALDSTALQFAELFFFGSAKAVSVNGKALPAAKRLESTGWSRLEVPVEWLRVGANEFVFRDGGQLLLEPGRPGRSFKSADAGATWSDRQLGRDNEQAGEYLIRLRLGRYPARGWVRTQVFDLWSLQPRTVVKLSHNASQQTQPKGTTVTAWLRTGTTPVADDKTWTVWIPFDKPHQPQGAAARHRYAQLKFDLATTDPQATPTLAGDFHLDLQFQEDAGPKWDGKLTFETAPNDAAAYPSTPFVYEKPGPRLKLLRERYKLDEVIKPGKTEMEQLMLLRWWVRNQWHTAWGNHPSPWMPPWDAHIILENRDQPDCLTMCTHYAAVFTQCCLALGWNARHCILDHHCVAEVYVNEHDHWVMMDAGNSAQRADVGLHFEKNGIPLSALQLRQLKTDDPAVLVRFTPKRLSDHIAHLCRPAPAAKDKQADRPDQVPLTHLKSWPVCGLENYRRFALPMRNNYLSSLLPGELYQGWSEYFFDGYAWVSDNRDRPKVAPEYSWQVDAAGPRAFEVDWKLNWCRFHVASSGKEGEVFVKTGAVQVEVETHTPNLANLEKKQPDGTWEKTPPRFIWLVRPGTQEMTVRSVNAWGKTGPPATLRANWKTDAK